MQCLFDANQQLIAKLLFMLILSRFSIPIFHIISFIFYYYNYFLSKLIRIVFAKPNCLRAAHWHCPGAISFDPLFCR